MGDSAHIAALRGTAEAWNAWRQQGNARRPDLRNARLNRLDLSAHDLHDALLDGAYIRECNLARANCNGISICGAELDRVYANAATFLDARLSGTSLSDVDFSFALLDRASFQRSFLE